MDLWDKTVEVLQTSVEPYDFRHWIRPIRCDAVDDDLHEIVLSVPNESHGRWIEEHFVTEIRRTLKRITTADYAVRVQSAPEERRRTRRSGKAKAPLSRLPDQPNLVARYRFEDFVDGPNARFAMTAARAVAESPGKRYNPLFIYGGVGLGKTHLLHAIGHAVLEARPEAQVLYVTSERYVNDLIAAIRTDRMDLFRARYRDNCDVLLVDDIQFIAGKDRTQEEFFHMFNTLHSSHKQIVMTSDQVPQSIPDMEERLRSRLQWGLIADVKPPGFETRVAIVERKAEASGIALPEDVAMLLARHVTRNVRELEGALMRLEAHARVFGGRVSLTLAEEVLGDLVDQPPQTVAPDTIIRAVANHFQVSLDQMKGPRRHRHITVPRQVAMFLIRELTDSSLPHIGALFGGRDHTTVINALKRIDSLCKADPELRQRIEALRRQLLS